MSATNRPYHLAIHKAIDRSIFLEILQRIDNGLGTRSFQNYQYIGLPGVFWEDFKDIHTRFGIGEMQAIECDRKTFKRQLRNRPYHFVVMHNSTASAFINNMLIDGNYIFWLDYTSPGEMRSQLDDFITLIQKSVHGDIIKITLNANPASLGTPLSNVTTVDTEGALLQHRLNEFCSRLDTRWIPNGIASGAMTTANFPQLLLSCLELAASVACEMENKIFLPLTSCSYADGQQMLTLTGIVFTGSESDVRDFITRSGIDQWPYYLANGWQSEVDKISVPFLTTQEKVDLDNSTTIRCRFDYFSQSEFDSFHKFKRHYPLYSKIVS